MKKFFALFAAALIVMSASAFDLASLKKLPAPKNLNVEKFVSHASPIRKAVAEWENVEAPFAPEYTGTGYGYDFHAPEGEDPWYKVDPWQVWAEEYDYEGEPWYGLVNIIPNEDMWVEDPVIDYFYDETQGLVCVPATPLAQYPQEPGTLIYIMDIYDFGHGEETGNPSGDIYFTLDKDGNFARIADCQTHAVAWAVAYYEEGTYAPVDILGYFGAYADMQYKTDQPEGVQNTAAAVKATKTIENGQVVILRGGQKFNALGASL